MDTRSKSNAEFRNEVGEILASHESRFEQILNELQALRLQQTQYVSETNPFSTGDTSNRRNPTTTIAIADQPRSMSS